MTNEDYIKLSKALETQVFFVADRANEIIRQIGKKNADKDGYLWLNSDDEIWVQDNKARVVYIYVREWNQTFIGVIDECCEDEDETHECFLYDLNPFERIEIADYLAERY